MRRFLAIASGTLVAGCMTGCGAGVRVDSTAPHLDGKAPKPSDFVAGVTFESETATFAPPPLDGGKIAAKNVEFLLPRGCIPLSADSFAGVAAKVTDAESELLAACNLRSAKGSATLVLLRHKVEIETGESAALAMLRAPHVIGSKTTTTAGPLLGSVGPEAVLALHSPLRPGMRPATSLYFGAMDGLYVLYAEVDGDRASLDAWSETLPYALRPTLSAKPIRWRAPTRLAPSATALGGPHQIKLPEGVSSSSGKSHSFSELIGDASDALETRDSRSSVVFRDEAGVGLGGTSYRVKSLKGVSPSKVLGYSAEGRKFSDRVESTVKARIGPLARIDGTRPDGSHGVLAILPAEGDEFTLVYFVVAQDKWATYAPWIAASLESIETATVSGPY